MPPRLHFHLKRRLPPLFLVVQKYTVTFRAANRVMEQSGVNLPPQRIVQQSLRLLIPR